VEASVAPLLHLFERERASGHALALGVLVHTAGSTYRKAGALILIAGNGDYAGLLSGGCLEGDLGEHARAVIETGQAKLVGYDMRGPEDLLWGLGLGCEGAMQILLLRVGSDSDWQPLTYMVRAFHEGSAGAVGFVTESSDPRLPAGTAIMPGAPGAAARAIEGKLVQAALEEAARSGHPAWATGAAFRLFALPLALPQRLLVLGAGPDALPVVQLAARLGWKVTVVDHRPAYARPAHFPEAEQVLQAPAPELAATLELEKFPAAVVMSHHLPSDLSYLTVLADSRVPYVGLLGPPVRRDKLLADLGARAQNLRGRLHAPVGFSLGGRSPEAIALAIIAQVHAFLHKADGKPADGAPA
jgi:xanthine/CO dehydrogenase XdhC/CoxF family maturation factor